MVPTRLYRLVLAVTATVAFTSCGGENESIPATSTGGGGSGGEIPTEKPDAGPRTFPCEPGELELDDGSCQPAGVPDGACGQGFSSDGDSGCVAILPADPCGPGTMALPGETACRSIAPCGGGTWGAIPVDGTTQHVDGSYAGGDGDGSAAKPWPTIQQAIDAAEPNAIIAVAAGSYAENLNIQSAPVRVWGKCPAEVEIVGDPNNGAAVYVHTAAASGTAIRDLAITGGSTGVLVDDSTDVVVDRAWIHDLTWIGAYAYRTDEPTSLAVSRSLIEGAVAHGIYAWGSTVALIESALRDTQPDGEGIDGSGLCATFHADDATASSLQVLRSLVERNHDYGLWISGSSATIEDSLIRQTAPQPSDGENGQGIHVRADVGAAAQSDLVMRGVVVADNHECGLCVFNSDAVVERTVVRDVEPPPATSFGTPMVFGVDGKIPNLRPTLVLRSSLFERGTYMGVGIVSADALVEGTIVRDIVTDAVMDDARGLAIEQDPNYVQHPIATLRGVRVERTGTFGIAAIGADVTIDSALVRDIAAQPSTGLFGRGIGFEVEQFSNTPSVGQLSNSLVENTTEAGLTVIGSDVEIDSVIIRDTQPRPLDGLLGRGMLIQISYETLRRATATVAWSLVEDNYESGIMVASADATIANTIVRNNGSSDTDSLFADGIVSYGFVDLQLFLLEARSTLTEVIIESNARAGISSFAAEVTVGDSWLDCNPIQMNGEVVDYYSFIYNDTGGNRCGCGGVTEECKVLSSNLSPPPLL